jgi:hypothetical protein
MCLINATIREIRDETFNLFYMDLSELPRLLDTKHGLSGSDKLSSELWSTWLLAVFLKRCGRPITGIGIPCKKGRIEGTGRPVLPFLQSMGIESAEVDSVIIWEQPNLVQYTKIQVVRYVHRELVSTDKFFRFLTDKKLRKYKTDPSLYLLVNIQVALSLEYETLNKMLLETEVPFASIFAVGHLGEIESLQFMAVKIYPRVEGPIKIDFLKPPPG